MYYYACNKLTSGNFVARLKQANLATKVHTVDFVEKTNFDDKLKNLNKKVTSNEIKPVEAEKKLTDLTNKIAQVSEYGMKVIHRWRWLSEFFSFYPNVYLYTDSNKKVTNCTLTGISSEKIKPFDTNF